MDSSSNWPLVTRISAGSMAAFLIVPMAIHDANINLACYIAAFLSFVVCLIGASRTRNADAATAAVDGSMINTPPMPGTWADGCDGGGGGDGGD